MGWFCVIGIHVVLKKMNTLDNQMSDVTSDEGKYDSELLRKYRCLKYAAVLHVAIRLVHHKISLMYVRPAWV